MNQTNFIWCSKSSGLYESANWETYHRQHYFSDCLRQNWWELLPWYMYVWLKQYSTFANLTKAVKRQTVLLSSVSVVVWLNHYHTSPNLILYFKTKLQHPFVHSHYAESCAVANPWYNPVAVLVASATRCQSGRSCVLYRHAWRDPYWRLRRLNAVGTGCRYSSGVGVELLRLDVHDHGPHWSDAALQLHQAPVVTRSICNNKDTK